MPPDRPLIQGHRDEVPGNHLVPNPLLHRLDRLGGVVFALGGGVRLRRLYVEVRRLRHPGPAGAVCPDRGLVGAGSVVGDLVFALGETVHPGLALQPGQLGFGGHHIGGVGAPFPQRLDSMGERVGASHVEQLAPRRGRRAVISSAGYGTSSSAGSGPGSIHLRAASVARVTGIRSCTRMVALASVMISV